MTIKQTSKYMLMLVFVLLLAATSIMTTHINLLIKSYEYIFETSTDIIEKWKNFSYDHDNDKNDTSIDMSNVIIRL